MADGAGKTALVTGSRGFAGSWLCARLLDDGYRVVGFDRGEGPVSGLTLLGIDQEVEQRRGELVDAEAVGEAVSDGPADRVFHLAAQTIVGKAAASPLETFETNVRGTWTLLEAARDAGPEAVVVASSDKAYGSHETLPYAEAAPLTPTFPYDTSKAAADLIARSYWHSYGLPVSVTRFANLYGGGDLNPSRLVPETVAALLEGRPPLLRSDGSPRRDFLYVEDAARAYTAIADTLAAGREGGEAFNAGSGRAWSVLEVVDMLCEISGKAIEPEVRGSGSPPGEIDSQYLDSSKIGERCDWQAEVPLKEGLERTYGWYSEHPEAVVAAAANA